MTKYKITHKVTKESISVSANDKESALQVVCSENRFSTNLKDKTGWWDRNEIEIAEA